MLFRSDASAACSKLVWNSLFWVGKTHMVVLNETLTLGPAFAITKWWCRILWSILVESCFHLPYAFFSWIITAHTQVTQWFHINQECIVEGHALRADTNMILCHFVGWMTNVIAGVMRLWDQRYHNGVWNDQMLYWLGASRALYIVKINSAGKQTSE